MADETENHTIRLMQEMRGEMREMRGEMRDIREDLSAFRYEVNERFDETNLRIDGLSHLMVLLAGNVAGHADRIEALEEAAGLPQV